MFFRSGDGLPKPQTLPPKYTSYASLVAHGRREGELPYSPEDDIVYSGSPSPGPDEGSSIQGRGFSRQGKEFVGMVDSAFLNGASDLHHRPKTPPVLIAVMGKTGTGKTSFINAVTGGKLTVGHDLEACEYSLSAAFPLVCLGISPNKTVGTQDIQAASTNINGREVWLIDTPGFDDTYRSDVDILSTIANWIQQPNHEHKHLSGIIYLHRIIDTRMEGSHMKNLRMFRELCGEENFGNVILCTTMWGKVSEEDGQRREEKLKSKETFWGSLISRGAQVVRHQGSDLTASAKQIVESLIPKDTIVLKLQEELGQGGSLSDTSAGRVLTSEIEDMKKKHEEEIAALRAEIQATSDKREVELLKEHYEKEMEGLKKVTDDLEKLRAGEARRFNKRLEDLQRKLDNADDLEKLRAGEARRFNERLEFLQRRLDNADDLEKLRAKDARRYNKTLDDLQRKLGNADDLEKLRAEEARRYNERLDDLQRKLDNSSGCIIL